MNTIMPPRLKSGDTIMVVAPSRSIGLMSSETRIIADRRFAELGLKLKSADHVDESDMFGSASVQSRVADLHAAFRDPGVCGILTVIGGHNANQLLRFIDWDIIRENPKVFCGYSDITALNNAILAKTSLITYSGPHYSSFSEQKCFEYSLDYFRKCLFSDEPFTVAASSVWSDDAWYLDQDNRTIIDNPGHVIIHEGSAEGTLIGGNLCTLNLLQGTEYFPDLTESILFLEDDFVVDAPTFDRDLQSLLHQPGASGIQGIVIGRFQKESGVGVEELRHIIESKTELRNIPVIVNVDFGHTTPRFTFPIGGSVRILAEVGNAQIVIERH